MDDRYRGWQPLIDRMRAACAAHGLQVHMKPKNGYLAVELPAHPPQELEALAETVEQHSDCMCQLCGAEPAVEIVMEGRYWIMTLCPACQSALPSEPLCGSPRGFSWPGPDDILCWSGELRIPVQDRQPHR